MTVIRSTTARQHLPLLRIPCFGPLLDPVCRAGERFTPILPARSAPPLASQLVRADPSLANYRVKVEQFIREYADEALSHSHRAASFFPHPPCRAVAQRLPEEVGNAASGAVSFLGDKPASLRAQVATGNAP